MKIIQLTPGSGDNFYCENCLRDNLLVQALRRQRHEAIILPMYLLPKLEETGKGNTAPVFFGGINVYLQQKFKVFRKSPGWLDRLLNSRWLLNGAARMAGMTDSEELAETTLSMLRGEEGRQAKELDKLIEWLVSEEQPDVVCLSNALLMGVARRIRQEVKAPVVCLLQDEDEFLEDLPEPLHGQCRQEMIERGKEIDRFVAVSRYYEQKMQAYLELDQQQVTCIYNGLLIDAYQPSAAPPPTPTIGFLARMYPKKGLEILAEAFVKLKRNEKLSAARLKLAGGKLSCDKSYVEGIRNKLAAAGVI
ncbi:MAG: glycosyltransferase family 4 protein, partial [Gammaproteobacteria bacterium]|nr:glycosyltransferase family 4 protein [Gammaproteobacteria bacterium]